MLHPRREHPLRATLSIAEGGLRAGDLATQELWCVEPGWPCGSAVVRMAELDFDVAPLGEEPLRRFVLRAELEEEDAGAPVAEVAHPIDATHMVTVDLGLADTLDLLAQREFLFVIEGGKVSGLITFSDLQRIPVGMVVLSMILATELGLNEVIHLRYGDDGFLDHLSGKRLQDVVERYEQLRRHNVETSLIDVLQLKDRLRLVGKVERLRRELGHPSRDRFESWAEELKGCRNALAHGRTLLDHQRDPLQALGLVRRIRSFAEAVWDLVEREERDARTGIDRGGSRLGGPETRGRTEGR